MTSLRLARVSQSSVNRAFGNGTSIAPKTRAITS